LSATRRHGPGPWYRHGSGRWSRESDGAVRDPEGPAPWRALMLALALVAFWGGLVYAAGAPA
jgi:hypothetical protein